jgi:hypothetical protein
VSEINIFGYTGTNLPTRLSIFRWVDTASGYQGEHYAGNARVESDIQPDGGNQITWVTTYNHLLNHRSLLCDVDSYTRPNTDVVRFIPDPSKKTIDFCFDLPDDPVYPRRRVAPFSAARAPKWRAAFLLADNALSQRTWKCYVEPTGHSINIVSRAILQR